jgi:tetratricopeptide (TPR) repeat protein
VTRGRRPGRRVLVAALAALAVGLTACSQAGGDALGRGDRLLSQGRTDQAIAEYRLAQRQQGGKPSILARLAHAYALSGDDETALQMYGQLLQADSSYRYQAATDLTAAARKADERGNEEEMARLLEPIVASNLSLVPVDLRRKLGDHAFDQGNYVEALPLLLSLPEDPGADSRVLYEMARSFEELGGCSEALTYFRRYLDTAPGDGSAEANSARWHYGNCLYEVATQQRRSGLSDDALASLDSLVAVGVPRTLQDRAQYLRGEVLLGEGRSQEALEAFESVLRLDPARTGPVARQAEERIRQIRYGG